MTEEGFLEDLGQSIAGAGKVARSSTIGAIQAISYMAVPLVCLGIVAYTTVLLVRLPGLILGGKKND
tara:strand:+ start:2016 stop:2216 length:201 start_codon:yes stop_codon:yes gene_type:complete